MSKAWLSEPNRTEGKYRGYKWLILRHDSLGHLCGYIALPKGHAYYEKDYDNIPIEVHGGWTFSQKGNGKYQPEGYWWIGFDCAHAGDLVPFAGYSISVDIYRDIKYVELEIKNAINQLKRLDKVRNTNLALPTNKERRSIIER